MPFDLAALEHGYGECDVEFNGHTIVVRYRANLNNRALIAMKRVAVGVATLFGEQRFPDIEAIIDELLHVLLPSGPDVPEERRGWDITREGVSIPITADELIDLPPGLPTAMLLAIMRDVNDPNRRRPSDSTSSRGAASPPIESPIITASSSPLNGQGSLPGPSEGMTTLPAGTAGSTG